MIKSKKSLFIYLLILLLLVSSACTGNSDSEDQDIKWSTYSGLNFEIELPSTWEIVNQSNYEVEFAPINDNEVAIALLLSQDPPYRSLSKVKTKLLDIIKNNYLEININSDQQITFNEQVGYEVEFSGLDLNVGAMQGHLIVANQAEQPFAIVFMAQEQKYEENLAVAQRIVRSLTLK